ncbi:peptide chain release factor 4 [Rothia mucilaginosa]|uniref:peptide chain release factor 4 n=1 Tax=uncultured Rothia sp. TaxID=316088 RepID=UPI0028D64D44|nr:peptide chain release factor 4 [uncultured Rothia sp.]
MGLLRSALLLGAGAAVGYFASRRAASEPAQRTPGSALLMREHGELALNPESQMGKFFDSPIGKPLQPYALRAVEFAARVREGMQEKEMELNAKVERQKQDLRPGSLDTWERGMSTTEIEAANRRIAEHELIEVESQIASLEKAREQRIARDRELGDDFFN